MVKINNTTILSAFRKQMGLSKAESTDFADVFQSVLEEALLKDKSVKINGLGTFKLILVEARKSVNVNTGEEIKIAEHYKLTFTPDAALRDKINEPLAHLETIELDDDTEVPTINVSADETLETPAEPIELETEPIDEPLQKLVEQAIELKDILADIQALGMSDNLETMDEVKPEEASIEESEQEDVIAQAEQQNEVISQTEETPMANQIVDEPAEKNVEAQNEQPVEGINTASDEECNPIAVAEELTKVEEKEPEETPLEPDVETQSPLSAQDIIAELNNEVNTPRRKTTWAWFSIAITLLLAIVVLLIYQNRDFFIGMFASANEEDAELLDLSMLQEDGLTLKYSDQELDESTVESQEESFVEDEFVEEINLEIENVVDSKVDASSDIYNSQFPDFFNYPREYTQFIDVVTINEGSRLTYISLKQYGHKDFWVYIYEANRDVIANPNSIKVGVKLRIPKLAPELIDANNQQCIDYARYLHDIYVNE